VEVKRMSAKQYKDACSLIRGLCCNYDRSTGGCLLLDNGEVVQCPQILTQALVCRYFRDVLLEDRDGKALKDSIFGTGKIGTTRTCKVCGKLFKAVGNRAKYCARCGKLVRREQGTARQQRKRHNVTQ